MSESIQVYEGEGDNPEAHLPPDVQEWLDKQWLQKWTCDRYKCFDTDLGNEVIRLYEPCERTRRLLKEIDEFLQKWHWRPEKPTMSVMIEAESFDDKKIYRIDWKKSNYVDVWWGEADESVGTKL